jgi:amphi-Trp domain-containing protein
MSKNTLTHSFVSDPDAVADFFQALIEGFKERKLSIASDGRERILIPAEILDLTVESVQRKGRVRLNLSLSWSEVDAYPKRDLFSNLGVRPEKAPNDEPES